MPRLDLTNATWRTSSYSTNQANCVQVAWRTSSYSSNQGNCVQVAFGDLVAVRDSKHPEGPVLAFPASSWAVFVRR
jgi:hypothetical protein